MSRPLPVPSADDWPYPWWIAHRGAGHEAPENTLVAFETGHRAGFRMFECDVKLSADDVPFLLHDPDLDRTTTGRGRAGDLPWDTLSRLDAGTWHSRAFRGERMPTLEQLAAWLRGHGSLVNLEIKPTPGTEARTGALVAAAAHRLWRDADATPLLSSFDVEALDAAAVAAPDLRRALLVKQPTPGWEDDVRRLGCVAVVLHAPLVHAELVEHLHAQGLRVLTYTVNRADTAARLAGWGIDGLITDAIPLFSDAASDEQRRRAR